MRRLFTYGLLSAMLVACLPTYHNDYRYVLPGTERGQICVQKCRQSRHICNQYCSSSSLSVCEAQERRRAREKYRLYVKDMQSKSKPIELTAESFFDPSYCRYANKETHNCNCMSDYRACFKMCGGMILETRVCESNCH